MSTKVNLELLRKLQKSAGVLSNAPESYDIFDADVPANLITAYRQYVESKMAFNKILTENHISVID